MIIQVPITLPESFEIALGYPGKSKWAAFYWEPCGDESMYDDGMICGDGNWYGFLSFVKHKKVHPWLVNYNLGSSDSEAVHWLLCDLEGREVFVGERKEVSVFLNTEALKHQDWTVESDVSFEEIEGMRNKALLHLIDEMQEVPAPSMDEVGEKLRREMEAVEKMVSELG